MATPGLKIGAYVFSQVVNENEALQEAEFTLDFIKDFSFDLPIFYDPETIKYSIARTDNVSKEQWTKNAIVFMNKVKQSGYETGLYSNMVWQDYYLDMRKFNDCSIWYADYTEIPQTPYHFNFWQFSETGIVDGVKDCVDLNVCLMPIE